MCRYPDVEVRSGEINLNFDEMVRLAGDGLYEPFGTKDGLSPLVTYAYKFER